MSKISRLISDFTHEQRIEGRKSEYIKLCAYRLGTFAELMNAEHSDIAVEEITPRHIKRYIASRQELGAESNNTINNNIATLKVFFNFAVEEGVISESDNPMLRIKNLKEAQRVLITFNDAEVKRIISSVSESNYTNMRNKLILIFLFETGVRVSELCDIRNDDISRGYILIRGKGDKERLVYISKTMRKYMRKYENYREERFKHKLSYEIDDNYFLDPSAQGLYRSTINRILRKHCKMAEVREEVRCSPHDCRHYFAQKQLRNGIDIYTLSRLLGHYDTQITAKYLRGLAQDDVLDIGRKHSPLRDMRI